MKRIINYLQGLAALAAFMLFSLLGYTQEGGGTDINVDINKDKGGDWYAQPWVWIIGGAVFILLLVALLRRGGERE